MNNYSRYIRQNNIIGSHGQDALANTKLLCIGCGGVGGFFSRFLVGGGGGLVYFVGGGAEGFESPNRLISRRVPSINFFPRTRHSQIAPASSCWRRRKTSTAPPVLLRPWRRAGITRLSLPTNRSPERR